MNAGSRADIVRGPTNRVMQEKVAEKRQGSGGGGGQPPGGGGGRPPGDGDDWQPDKRTQQKVQAAGLARHRPDLRRDAVARLTARGFVLGTTTYVCPLAATVSVGQQSNIPTHVTVDVDDLNDVTNATVATTTLDQVLASLPYHVTVEEYDERYEADNPRRYGRDGKWNTHGSRYGAAVTGPAKTAVDEAKEKMRQLAT